MGIGILISIIAAAGLLGGVANYYMNQVDRVWLRYDFIKSSLLGLTAAATVPLFLKTVSSNLMQECLNGDIIAHFVFFGFCAVAAIFSSKFLQSLADKLLQEVKEVKQQQQELAETTETLVVQNSDKEEDVAAEVPVEDHSDGSEFESFSGSRGAAPPVIVVPEMSDEQKILKALKSGKYAFRTLAGLSKETRLDGKAVAAQLLELETKGLVKKIKRASDGATVWSLR